MAMSQLRQAARLVGRGVSSSPRRAPVPGRSDLSVNFSSFAGRTGSTPTTPIPRSKHTRRHFLSGRGFASESETAGGGILVSSGHPSSHPQVLVVPLNRRPLMPGVIMPVRVTDERLISEIEEMKSRGQAYVGTFLRRKDVGGIEVSAVTDNISDVDSDSTVNWDPTDDMHSIGTFAQVQSVIRIPDIGEVDEDGDKILPDVDGEITKTVTKKKVLSDEDTSGGATLLLLGHRRLRKTHTVRSDPMVVRVEHLGDKNSNSSEDSSDDVLKATANEVVATIKELLKVNPLAKVRFGDMTF